MPLLPALFLLVVFGLIDNTLALDSSREESNFNYTALMERMAQSTPSHDHSSYEEYAPPFVWEHLGLPALLVLARQGQRVRVEHGNKVCAFQGRIMAPLVVEQGCILEHPSDPGRVLLCGTCFADESVKGVAYCLECME